MSDDDKLDALIGAAIQHVDDGDFESAVSVHQQIVQLDPSGERFADLSELLIETGALAEAEDAATRALELDPDHYKAYILKADLADRRSEFAEADVLLRRGVRRGAVLPDEHVFAVYRRWAEALVAAGRQDEARDAICVAAEFFQGHVPLRLLAGGLAERSGETLAALKHYKRSLDDLPRGALRTDVLEKIASLV